MKKIYSLFIAFIATTTLSFGQWTSLPIYESFNYAEGNLGLSTATVAYPWNYGSTKSAVVVAGPNLTYTGMTTTENKVIKLVNIGSAVNMKTLFPVQTVPIYTSFLYQVLSAPAVASTRIASFGGTTNSSGTFSPGIFIDQSGSGFKIGFDGIGGTASVSQSAEFALNTTVMVIMKYTASATAGGGTAYFWINPTSTSLSTTPDISGVSGGLIKDVNFLTIKTGIGAADVLMDELHISTSWADVAPASGPTKVDLPTQMPFGLSTTILKNKVSVTNCTENVKVNFYTADLKLVKSVALNGNSSINVSDLNKGIYLIKISSNSINSIVKAIKE